jgi:RsiW-degrading membrane proteinase PrsW (M82 family)
VAIGNVIECDHCGVEVEAGPFCSACGAHLKHHDQGQARARHHAFAAHPHEAVHYPSILTTILPHLTQISLHKYRWTLLIGAALVILTLMAASVGAAVILAAFVVPLVYVMYIYDVDVHEGEPILVIASTVVIGAIVGALVAVAGRFYVANVALPQMAASLNRTPGIGMLLFLGVAIPIVGELAKLIGPLTLRRWPHFRNEVMDGTVFGVASGVGFASGSTVVNYWPFIVAGYSPAGAAGLSDWTATLLGLALLRPLVHGTTSGLIGSGIWAAYLHRSSVALPIGAGFGGAVAYPLLELFLLQRGTLVVLASHVLLLGVLLILLRRIIHEDLLTDARALGMEGSVLACNNCGRETQARVFCTHCGTALRAQPKRVRVVGSAG